MADEPVRRITAFIPHEAGSPSEAGIPGGAGVPLAKAVPSEPGASPRRGDASAPIAPQPRPVTDVLVERAYAAGMMGATISTAADVAHDTEETGAAEGAANLVLPAWFGLPQVVTIFDSAEKVEQFVPAVEAVVSEGLIIIDDAPEIPAVAAEDEDDGEA